MALPRPDRPWPHLPIAAVAVTIGACASTTFASDQQATTFALLEDYSGEKFFEGFEFFDAHDPTDGCVEFLGKKDAFAAGLAGVNAAGQVYMRTDNTSMNPKDASGRIARRSIRVHSKRTYDPKTLSGGTDESGKIMLVLDVAHMPTGCATWPSWWMNSVRGTWPEQGEMDLIEGVHDNTDNTYSMHTIPNCSQASVPEGDFTGHWINSKVGNPAKDCYIHARGQDPNQGCSIGSDPSANAKPYGAPFNAAGGGVYVMLWEYEKPTKVPKESGRVVNDGHMTLWFFARNNIPQSLQGNSPQPPLHVKPMGRYHTSEQDCPAGHFNEQQMIFDITLCGQWAGREFLNAGCGHAVGTQSPYEACDAYVGANPTAFSESRWEINSLRAFGSWAKQPTPAMSPGLQSGLAWWMQLPLVFVAAGVVVVIACVVAVRCRRSRAATASKGALSEPIVPSTIDSSGFTVPVVTP